MSDREAADYWVDRALKAERGLEAACRIIEAMANGASRREVDADMQILYSVVRPEADDE